MNNHLRTVGLFFAGVLTIRAGMARIPGLTVVEATAMFLLVLSTPT